MGCTNGDRRKMFKMCKLNNSPTKHSSDKLDTKKGARCLLLPQNDWQFFIVRSLKEAPARYTSKGSTLDE